MGAKGLTRTAVVLIAMALTVLSMPANAGYITHRVRTGDTLWDLAKKHRTSPQAIARANGISENAILTLGKPIRIPAKHSTSKPSRVSKRRQSVKYDYTVHVKASSACLRKGPSTGHARIAVLAKGTTAKLLARRGSWAKIALADGRCGFVYRPLMAAGAGTRASTISPPATANSHSEAPDPDLVRMALNCRGDRYRRGGTSRGGFDCSGFTRYVFAKYGIRLPHSSAAQSKLGTRIPKSNLRPGDLVFFQTYRRGISHVGIYIGDGKFVHASHHGRGVVVDSMNSSYYAPRFRGARRIK